ncbi:alpha/beta fold hydrolase [Prauserella oleivorans]
MGDDRFMNTLGRGALTALAVATLLSTGATPVAAEPDRLHWTPCATENTAKTLECATVAVPLDWSDMDGPTIDIAVNRIPAKDPERRIGTLFVNPGGPGGVTTDVVAATGFITAMPEGKEIGERFDVVGMDPRGVGKSSPVRCDADLLLAPDIAAFPADRAAFDARVQSNRAAGEACLERTGPLLGHVDTLRVVRDMDAVRAAMGEERISFYGTSYGTEIGELYAAEFGEHVRAMVLDAAVDHALPSADAAVDEAAATEEALDRFAAWCAGDPACAVRGEDVHALVKRLAAHGVPAPSLGRSLTGDEVTKAVYIHLNAKAAWAGLGQALAAATAPEPDGDAFAQRLRFVWPDYPAYRSVGCQDFRDDPRGPRRCGRRRNGCGTWRRRCGGTPSSGTSRSAARAGRCPRRTRPATATSTVSRRS